MAKLEPEEDMTMLETADLSVEGSVDEIDTSGTSKPQSPLEQALEDLSNSVWKQPQFDPRPTAIRMYQADPADLPALVRELPPEYRDQLLVWLVKHFRP